MAFLIVDRRLNSKHKSAVNRQRFLHRYRKHIKKAVSDAVNNRSITDTDRGEDISIPKKDVAEPVFRNGRGGSQKRVLPGNKEFVTGDRIARPPSGGGQGSGEASNQGEGMDEFVFHLTQEEYLDFIFDGLELPNLVKKQLRDSESYKLVKGGFTREGIPARLNVVQSLRSAQGRRIALSGAIKRRIKALEKDIAELRARLEAGADEDPSGSELALKEFEEKLERQRRRLNQVPFLDDLDLRYNNMIEQPVPTSCAVMFCLLDVSGSMTREIKDMAKRFFILLHLFLRRNYQKVDVVFIRHHTVANEVDEDEFFYSRETGGTVVSSALKLMNEIIDDRYPSNDWNVYAAQASDGDNWADDSPTCRDLLVNAILPKVQYFTYVEVTPDEHQALWEAYSEIQNDFEDKFAMQEIHSPDEIYPVFRSLFESKTQ